MMKMTIKRLRDEKIELNCAQKLLESMNMEKSLFSYDILCLACHGIVVNPVKCKLCKGKYCEECFSLNKKNNLICYCKKAIEKNFEKYLFETPLKTTHFIKKILNSETIYGGISYDKAISRSNQQTIFVSSKSVHANSVKSIYQEFPFLKSYIHRDINKVKEGQKQLFKYYKYINFMTIKGIILRVNHKILNKNFCLFLILLRIKEIFLCNCKVNCKNAFLVAQAIIKNRSRLKLFYIESYPLDIFSCKQFKRDDIKCFILIFHALSFCKFIKKLFFNVDSKTFSASILENWNAFDFLENLQSCTHLFFKRYKFDCKNNYHGFDKLINLKYIGFQNCTFSLNSFFEIIGNLIKISKFILIYFNGENNSIEGSLITKKRSELIQIIEKNCILQKFDLTYGIIDENSFDCRNIFLKYILNSKKFTIKNLKLSLDDKIEGFTSPELNHILFLFNISQINLDIDSSFNGEFVIKYELIKNSKFLQSLKIVDNGEIVNWNILLYALTYNQTITDLNLNLNNLSNFHEDLIQLITQNHFIHKLNLYNCDIIIEQNFVEALLSNKSITHLDISSNKIKDEAVSSLLKCSIQKISVGYLGFNKNTETRIYNHLRKWELNIEDPFYVTN